MGMPELVVAAVLDRLSGSCPLFCLYSGRMRALRHVHCAVSLVGC
jgi:hypothetical protein